MISQLFQKLHNQKWQLAVIIILTTAVYLNIFQNQFVIDDKTFIVNWQTKNSLANVFDLIKGAVPEGHEGVYRPVRSIFYTLFYQIFHENPFGYHLNSILVHLASTILIYFISLKIFSSNEAMSKARASALKQFSNLAAFFVALLFGLHPIHTETVTYMTSAMDTWGIVFMLGSFYLYLRAFQKLYAIRYTLYAISIILAGLAFFTFEVTLVLPLLMILYDFCFKSFKSLKTYAPYFLLAAIYLGIRFFLIHAGSRGPYPGDSIFLTFLTMTKVFVKYIGLTIFPWDLANNHVISKGIEAFVYRDYRMEAIKAQSLLDLNILGSLGILGGLGWLGVKFLKTAPIVTFSIAWFFICLLPVSEIIPQGSMLNERFLYLPSFGFVLLLVVLLNCYIVPLLRKIKSNLTVRQLAEQCNNFLAFFLIGLSVVYGVLTYQRNRDWHDSVSLWSKDIKSNPTDNAYAYFQLGNAYFEQEKADLAIQNYQKSYEINPHFGVSLASIARTYENIGKLDKAIEFYKQTIEKNPSIWEAHLKLGDIYSKRADYDLAASEYDYLIANFPQFKEFKTLRGNLGEIKNYENAEGIKQENVWIRYKSPQGYLINYPSTWSLTAGPKLTLISHADNFTVELRAESFDSKLSPQDYLNTQSENFGELKNQGEALIPNFDSSYVKVFEDSGVQKMLFFLFKDNRVFKILVGPANSDQMRTFDIILASIKML